MSCFDQGGDIPALVSFSRCGRQAIHVEIAIPVSRALLRCRQCIDMGWRSHSDAQNLVVMGQMQSKIRPCCSVVLPFKKNLDFHQASHRHLLHPDTQETSPILM